MFLVNTNLGKHGAYHEIRTILLSDEKGNTHYLLVLCVNKTWKQPFKNPQVTEIILMKGKVENQIHFQGTNNKIKRHI